MGTAVSGRRISKPCDEVMSRREARVDVKAVPLCTPGFSFRGNFCGNVSTTHHSWRFFSPFVSFSCEAMNDGVDLPSYPFGDGKRLDGHGSSGAFERTPSICLCLSVTEEKVSHPDTS